MTAPDISSPDAHLMASTPTQPQRPGFGMTSNGPDDAASMLQQVQKLAALGQLTGGIAHDFNNMLQGVIGAIDVAEHRMACARASAMRAAMLTRHLLAFARQDGTAPQPIDPAALLREIEDVLRRTLGPAMAIVLRLGETRHQVSCNPIQFENAVLNLCINARDAMPAGGQVTISTAAVVLSTADIAPDDVPPGPFIAIEVADTGIGMPPEVLQRARDPFFTMKAADGGTGLGLSQVDGFARAAGGLLRIVSTPGQGTTVRILLPCIAAAAATAELGAAAERHDTILIVDDEAAVRTPVAEYLRDLGYDVTEAADGPTALALLDDGLRPDLLLADFGLPHGMDGISLAETTRRQAPNLRVIVITGYAQIQLPANMLMLTKPFTLPALADCVQKLLGAGTPQA